MLSTRLALAFALMVSIAGCGSSSDAPLAAVDSGTPLDGSVADAPASVDGADAKPNTSALVAARPFVLKVPTGYDKSKPTPLVVLLHGYTASGATQEAYFQFSPVADAKTFLYAMPDGLQDTCAAPSAKAPPARGALGDWSFS